MAVSVFDLFKIGIGPSSSHTVGPMRAAARFASHWLEENGVLERTERVRAEVFGSLALTGRGHGTDKAVLMGLEGHWPNEIDPDVIPAALERIRKEKKLLLLGRRLISFDEKHDLIMNKRQKLPFHTNGMRFTAYDAAGEQLATRDYYSVGGGFVVNADEAAEDRIVADTTELPYPFNSGNQLLQRCQDHQLSMAGVMLANELTWRTQDQVHSGLRELWQAMQDCTARGIRQKGTLPGGLHVLRRAPSLHAELSSKPEAGMRDPLTVLDWVNLYALAVNEENAGLTAALGGTPGQVENAAEIGMEHNLGLTCDPIGGLVQIPCIERNAMGAVKAINASRMALRGDGQHKVSLDKVIRTMRDTGRDMQDKYKETSRGGLAVNVIEC
jgi:L-serine dehydratase